MYGQLSVQRSKFKVSKNSAFKPYISQPGLYKTNPYKPNPYKTNPYNIFMDIIESGEIKIATKKNEILTPAESIILFETMKVRYQEGVIKVVNN
jgi:hypothetical protein